jgi:hypothetical protein
LLELAKKRLKLRFQKLIAKNFDLRKERDILLLSFVILFDISDWNLPLGLVGKRTLHRCSQFTADEFYLLSALGKQHFRN